MSVHRADCPNASDAKRAEEPGRWIRVDWATGELATYQTALDISAKDRDGLTLDVAMALSAAKVKTTSLSARSMPDGYATVSIVLEVKNQEELTNVINKLGQIQGVYQVKRASGWQAPSSRLYSVCTCRCAKSAISVPPLPVSLTPLSKPHGRARHGHHEHAVVRRQADAHSPAVPNGPVP